LGTPTISAALAPPPNAHGWRSTPVTAHSRLSFDTLETAMVNAAGGDDTASIPNTVNVIVCARASVYYWSSTSYEVNQLARRLALEPRRRRRQPRRQGHHLSGVAGARRTPLGVMVWSLIAVGRSRPGSCA